MEMFCSNRKLNFWITVDNNENITLRAKKNYMLVLVRSSDSTCILLWFIQILSLEIKEVFKNLLCNAIKFCSFQFSVKFQLCVGLSL